MEPEEAEFVETPKESVVEPEPMTISTGGKWMSVETLMKKEFENGKIYHIRVKGRCQFMVSKEKPTMGMATNEITFKKQPDMKLWIKTGE